jgi:hypothetical protein
MAESSRPWNGTVVGDAGPYSDANWQEIWRNTLGVGGLRGNVGIFLGTGTQPNEGLRVQAQGSNASIDVLQGAALVRGVFYVNTATTSFVVASNASGNPRIDTVVLRSDYALQTVRLALKQGTPAATPVPPTLTQSAGIMWEIPVADIAAADGFTVISQGNITPRHEWVNAPPGVYLDNVLNNSGAVLEDGDVVVWDNTVARAVTTTTTLDNKSVAGVWRARAAAGEYGRVQTRGIGYVRVNAAVAIGNILVSSATARQAAVSAGANNKIIGRALEATLAAGLALCDINVHMVRDEEYILIRDEKASGGAAASLTLNGWRQRELNTEVFDTGGFASVAANQITLEAGTYEIHAGAPVDVGRQSRARWQNITAGATTLEGSNLFGAYALVIGQFTITVQTVFQLQHWVNATSAGGTALTTGETEKYAWVYLVRKAETP